MVVRMQNVGGALVKRPFNMGTGDEIVRVPSGRNLTAAQVASIPVVNRTALVNKGYLDLYPMPPGSVRHIVSAGFGRYHVIEGVRLTEEPLTKEECLALAGFNGEAMPEEKPKEATPPAPPTELPPSPKKTRAKQKRRGNVVRRTVRATPP